MDCVEDGAGPAGRTAVADAVSTGCVVGALELDPAVAGQRCASQEAQEEGAVVVAADRSATDGTGP